MTKKIFILDAESFQQKRYEASSKILAAIVSHAELSEGDSKLRSSFVFNCIDMADLLLEELGYSIEENFEAD